MLARYQQAARDASRLALACLLAPALSSAAEPAATTGRGCAVSEFRWGALLTHAPAERKTFAVAWLKKNVDSCSISQLKAIVDNRPNWLGTADTGEIAQQIGSLLERRTGGSKKLLANFQTASGRADAGGKRQRRIGGGKIERNDDA